FSMLREEIDRCEVAGADLLHIDIMDGHFVPNLTMGPCVVKKLRPVTKLPFDVHLMVTHPEHFIEPFADAGADYITFHLEAESHLDDCIEKARRLGVKVGLSINPPTPIEKALPYLDRLDMLLVMSVNPGFAGQGFISEVLSKIARAREEIEERGLNTVIEVDGGITDQTSAPAAKAGAEIFVAGSYLFKGGDMAEKIRVLKELGVSGQ
ncbi:MAG: ribulose-phosphate 3-epimerase, partial [Thermoplasmata archaeon]|nr:ribulose-phosphate 3-epimerase [Thermoplasmata archaeon]